MERKKRSVIAWGAAGILLALCTLGVTIYGLNSDPTVLMDTAVITNTAEQTLECVCSADYETLEQLLYGSPDLGPSPVNTGNAESLILFAYLDSIQYQMPAECYVTESGMAVDVVITCLDIPAVTAAMKEGSQALILQLAGEKDSEEEIYDADHNYKEAFVEEVLCTAAKEALAAPQTTQQELTIELVQSNGRWLVVPTNTLLQLLTGFVSA